MTHLHPEGKCFTGLVSMRGYLLLRHLAYLSSNLDETRIACFLTDSLHDVTMSLWVWLILSLAPPRRSRWLGDWAQHLQRTGTHSSSPSSDGVWHTVPRCRLQVHA